MADTPYAFVKDTEPPDDVLKPKPRRRIDWKAMKVGDKILIPANPHIDQAAAIHALRGSLKRHHGFTVVGKQDEQGIWIWRTA